MKKVNIDKLRKYKKFFIVKTIEQNGTRNKIIDLMRRMIDLETKREFD